MPIYEYKCLKCSIIKERHLPMEFRNNPLKCVCKGEMKRIISKTSFALKGGGWYKDGYQK